MADYTVIGDASATILGLLRAEMSDRSDLDVTPAQIRLASPDEIDPESDVRLSVYLYKISKDGQSGTTGRVRVTDDRYREPPLPLRLRYLLTAYPDQKTESPVQNQQRTLGFAIQVIHDNAVLTGDTLEGSLESDDSLRVTLHSEATDEVEDVWESVSDRPIQPSVIYEVGPVTIDSAETADVSAVTERDVSIEARADDADE